MHSGYYVAEAYDPARACPNCGGKMTPVTYYVANYDGTSSRVDDRSLPGKVITTYTSRYSNIRRKTGGLCTACHIREEQAIEKKHRNMVIGLGAGAACALLLFLWYVLNLTPDFAAKYGVLGILGLIVAPVCGYFAWKSFATVRMTRRHWKTVANEALEGGLSREQREEVLSSAYVSEADKLGFFCQRNERLLSLYFAQSLQRGV